MLSHQQILHFRTFGYVTLRGLLSRAEADTLRQEVTGALADAFGQIAAEPSDLGGISGGYLPLAASRAPFSLSLIADDPRTFQSSAELLGGVTLWADLEPRTASTGALRLIPGSHLPGFERRLCEYRAAEPATSGFGHWEWPHIVVETEPGDVVAFHAHLMNRAEGGTPRLSWTIDYLPWPGLGRPDQMEVVRRLVLDAGEFGHEDYDRDRWPTWRDWVAGAAQIPSRAVALERLQLLGALTDASDG
jgi:hypothetical protein